MVKEQKSETNQLNLTVVALVALVAIVGLVALVMNAATIAKTPVATGSQLAAADPTEQNAAGELAGKRNLVGDVKTRTYGSVTCPIDAVSMSQCWKAGTR
jgi:hypothetical protein